MEALIIGTLPGLAIVMWLFAPTPSLVIQALEPDCGDKRTDIDLQSGARRILRVTDFVQCAR